MEHINFIVEGYNKEKNNILNKILSLDKIPVDTLSLLKNRIKEIDGFLKGLSLLKNQVTKKTKIICPKN